MLTRRLSPFTAVLLSTVLSFVGACDSDDKDDKADDETSSDSKSSDSDTPDTSSEDSTDVCEEACANLGSCGIPADACLEFCTDDACGACLANSESCGEDCADACGDGPGDGDGDPSGDGDGDIPDKECVINNDCGLSFECVSCNLNDAQGWCEQSSECNFDTDCGFGGKCGYNVETSAFRCLPAEYCG